MDAQVITLIILLVMIVLVSTLWIRSIRIRMKPRLSEGEYASQYRTGDGNKAWERDQMMRKARAKGRS
jgi:hypothetical protein